MAGDSVADRAERVLLGHARGPISVSELSKELGPDSVAEATLLAPHMQLIRALQEDDRIRTAQGKRPRFVIKSGESVRLRAAANRAELAVEEWNEEVKRDLLLQLIDCEPAVFEQIVGELTRAMGYEDVRVTRYSKDGGIDIRALFSAGGLVRVPTALQVKRWRRAVDTQTVQAVRGSLWPGEQGVIVTTGRFTKPAVLEARRETGIPVSLIDGPELVDLMVEHGLGVHASRIAMFSLDEGFLAGGPTPGTPTLTLEQVTSGSSQEARQFYLPKLPARGGAALTSVVSEMARLAEHQPTVDEYVSLFQEQYPGITRADEARRRMRVLLSLGLVDIESDHVALTFLGRRFIDEGSAQLLREAFLARIFGAREILNLAKNVTGRQERESVAVAQRPTNMSETQATRVLSWLTELGFLG